MTKNLTTHDMLQAQLDTLTAAKLRSDTDLAKLQIAMIAQQKAAQQKQRALETQIKGLKSSTSWRVTSPLRAVMRKIRR